MYQLTAFGCIKRLADNAFIPFDPVNADYQAYLAWLAEGNEPLPAPEPERLTLQQERDQASLSRFEFASRAAQAGFVTYPEAAAWATGQAMPANVQALIETLPEERRGPILLDVLAMPAIRRNGSIMPAIIAAFGATEEQADALFGIGV